MQKFGKNRDKQKVAMAKLDHHIADVRLESVETGRTRAYGDAAEYKSHLPDMRLCLKRHRKRPALFKCVSCAHGANADVAAAINSKERGQSSLACGESEKKTQVNSGPSKKPSTNQQHDLTEVISGASCLQSRICLVYGRETVNNARANSSAL